jgi:hypothetical protein
MYLSSILGIISVIIVFGCYIPYMVDIYKGKVKPARAARIMFTALTVIALFQQRDLGSGWTLAVTVGEVAGSVLILWAAIKHGVGGMKKTDIICYVLLALSVFFWLTTKNAFVALHFTVFADLVAFFPTLMKTWNWPNSETPLFFIAGVIAPILSIIAGNDYSYAIVLFPLYLALINLLEVGFILRKKPVTYPV